MTDPAQLEAQLQEVEVALVGAEIGSAQHRVLAMRHDRLVKFQQQAFAQRGAQHLKCLVGTAHSSSVVDSLPAGGGPAWSTGTVAATVRLGGALFS